MTNGRTTKYTEAVKTFIDDVGHATNAQILQHLQATYPDVSATTVHRITARMVERGEIAFAPVTADKSARFDAKTTPHDHFQCTRCDCLRDIKLPPEVCEAIQCQMEDCKCDECLCVQGICKNCIKKSEKKS